MELRDPVASHRLGRRVQVGTIKNTGRLDKKIGVAGVSVAQAETSSPRG